MDQPIGIFDSGIGGLTLAHALVEALPQERLFYFGDTAHFPYGDKSTSAIQAYSVKICNVLLHQKAKAIVIACNSASSAAYDLLKEYVGHQVVVINVVDPVVEYVGQHFAGKKVGLIGTKRTVASNVYKRKIDDLNQGVELMSLATPLLAPMIEEGFFNNQISHDVIANYLSHEDFEGIEALILGCTHYPLIKNEVSEFFKGTVNVIDSTQIVANAVKEALAQKDLLSAKKSGEHTFYVSDFTNSFKESTSLFFGSEVQLQEYRLW